MPIHLACQFGRVKNVELLLSQPDIKANKKDRLGYAPIHLAAKRGSLGCVEALMKHGQNKVTFAGKDRMQPLHFACAYNHFELAEWLLSNKANINCRDKCGRTPLILAVRNGLLKIVSLLLKRGADF